MTGTFEVEKGKVCLLVQDVDCRMKSYLTKVAESFAGDSFEFWVVGETPRNQQIDATQTFRDLRSVFEHLRQRSDIRLLHVRGDSTMRKQFGSLCGSLPQGTTPIVLHDIVDSRDELAGLEEADAVIVHNRAQQLRVFHKGLEADRVHLVTYPIEPVAPMNSHERGMLRRGFNLPDTKLLYCTAIPQYLHGFSRGEHVLITTDVSALSMDGVHVVTPNHEPNLIGLMRAMDGVILTATNEDHGGLLNEALTWNIPVFAEYELQLSDFHGAIQFFSGKQDLSLLVEALDRDHGFRRELVEEQESWILAHSVDALTRQLRSIYSATKRKPRATTGLEAAPDKEVAASSFTSLSNFRVGTEGKANMRVLLQNRPNAESCPGGDTELMHCLEGELKSRGISVSIDHSISADYSKFDVVHLFNFAVPQLLEQYARRIHECGVPFVVTTLNEDVPLFYTQGLAMAQALTDYVRLGQKPDGCDWSAKHAQRVQPASAFNNEWVASNAASLLSCGPSETSTLRRDYPRATVTEVPFGFRRGVLGSADFVADTIGVRDYVLCVGRLEFRKNQLGLLKALEHSPVPVVLAGGGFSYFPDYAAAVKSFKRAGSTIVLDRLSNEDLAHVFAGARVHCLPSWYELPGLVSLEAAYQGCEVVATKYGAAFDYLGEHAYYCEPGDVDSVRVAVEQALSGSRNAKLVQHLRNFTWQNTGERLLVAYQNAIASTIRSTGVAVRGDLKHVNVDDFYEVLKKGENAAKQHQYTTAVETLQKAIRMNEKSARAHRALGAVYLAQGRHDAGLKCMQKAVEIDPADPRSISGVGMALLGLNQFERAHQEFVKAIKLAPFQVVTLFQLLQTSQRLERYEDLIASLRSYCEEKTDDADMRFCLAGALFKVGDFAGAQEHNVLVLAKSPEHQGAKDLALSLKEIRVDSPAAKASEAINRDPVGVFDANDMKLAQIEERKRRGEFQLALEDVAVLREETLRDDQRMLMEVLHGECMLLSGEVEEGKRLIGAAFTRYPGEPRVLCAQGAVLCFEGQWEDARGLFDRALLRNPRCDIALAGLGGYLQQQGSLDEAWNKFQAALDVNPESKRALLGTIQLGFEMGRLEDLETRLRAYLELHPASTEFLYSLAGCLFSQGRYEDAVEPLRRMQIFEPENKDMLELMERLEEKMCQAEDEYGSSQASASGIKLTF